MSKLTKVLDAINPTPRIVDIGGEGLEFHQLTLADFAEIEKQTGIDITRDMFKANRSGNPEEIFSSQLINWVIYLSLKRGQNEIAKDLTPGTAAEIASYGLRGDQLAQTLVWAISGATAEELEERGSEGKKARKSPGSTGTSRSQRSEGTTELV